MSIELQELDCNCNFCKHLIRDTEKTAYWREQRRKDQFIDFEKEKTKAIDVANSVLPENGQVGMLRKANKMQFQFEQKGIIMYGNCAKFNNKPISFIPTLLQLETQNCFEHRKL